ncbi:hypothetical protein, partial [Pseudomonas sp. PDM08]|uniref:hypothetical protein n=1 Tax=Pseudomonas sp. PDM08 TaxID=2769265 RepID=UPI001CE08835
QHFHADHPVFSCSESEQKQLNTWVSFQSAEQPLLGQFSVSGNKRALARRADVYPSSMHECCYRIFGQGPARRNALRRSKKILSEPGASVLSFSEHFVQTSPVTPDCVHQMIADRIIL